MTELEVLIRLLADGEFHSGEEVGRQLGVSRAAVWKRLKKITEFGLAVESVRGRGYRLTQKLELLGQSTLTAYLRDALAEEVASVQSLPAKARSAKASGGGVAHLDVLFDTASTNDYAMARLGLGEVGKGYLCIAEFQRKGRGRRGRHWISPLGSGLAMSLVWEFEDGAAALEGLSLVTGVAIVRALRSLGIQQAAVKWPNDVLVNGSKLGGILLEMSGDPSGSCQVVIGVGINVFMSTAIPEIDQPWTAVVQYLPDVSRNQLAAVVIGELFRVLKQYSGTGFAFFKEEWLKYHAFTDCRVVAISGSDSRFGVITGVADNGALLLAIDGVETPVHGGEISLRLHTS